MKRSIIITIGIVIILAIIGMWGYLLVYGAPQQTQEVFSNLGIIPKPSQEIRIVDPETQGKIQSQLGLTGSNLQQLTLRAVAGFTFASSSSNTITYMERGTGHVFEINMETGKESQISLTTIPKIVDSVFSPEGTSVVFTIFEGYEKKVSLGTINKVTTSLTVTSLPQNAENIAFKDNTSFYYTIESPTNTTGYSYDLNTSKATQVFTTPLTGINVVWGRGHTGITLHTKPAASLEGYAYTISNNTLTPLPQKGYGLTLLSNNQYTITSTITDGNYQTQAVGSTVTTKQPILMLREKCAFDSKTIDALWCATPIGVQQASYLENWYKGAQTSNDYLWYTKVGSQSATLVGDLPKLAGKTLDVAGLTINNTATLLLFSNKIDQTLWMYKIEKQ